MSQFEKCADAIRYRGFDATANLVQQLADRPKLFAAVSITHGEEGELSGFDQRNPRLFLTRQSAQEDAARQTYAVLRTLPLSELIERFEMTGHQVNATHLTTEMTRIFGKPVTYPSPGVRYWADARCQEPLLPADATDQQAAEVATLLKYKFFKVISVPCDVNLASPAEGSPETDIFAAEQERRIAAKRTERQPTSIASRIRSMFRRR